MRPLAARAVCIISAVLSAALLLVCAHGENDDEVIGDTIGAADVDARELDIGVFADDAECDVKVLTDGVEKTYTAVASGSSVTVTSTDGTPIGSLYVIFDRVYGDWTLSGVDGEGKVHTVGCGGDLFLHEYVDVKSELGGNFASVTMTFAGGDASLSELYAFSAGRVPDWVQIWKPPCARADLMLATTHVDDEQLFFAGVLPYYAGERGYAVQVVYFTDPFKYHDRPHEQLNGLWTVGVRNYPVCGQVVDEYSESAKDAYAIEGKHGLTKDDMVRFQVEMIRRFRPHVIVGHDFNGEYGHGQHMINCETLTEALPLAADASYDAESAERYGVWDVPKTYIHLWGENEIVMDWDVPLDAFGGRTAFEMTQEGFRCHKSQHWTWFYGWIYGKNGKTISKATDIKTYSPCKYGLYRTNVGVDTGEVADMFENIPQSYAEIDRAEMESMAAAEAQHAAEESSRAESAREESQRLAEEEKERARVESAAQTSGSAETEQESGRGGCASAFASSGAVCVIAVSVAAASAVGTKKKR